MTKVSGTSVPGLGHWYRILLSQTFLALSCASDLQEEELRLVSFRQGGEKGIFLNEALVFEFNERIDPASLTLESISVEDSMGKEAEGRFRVEDGGFTVKFYPKEILSPSLDDGGFKPGGSYRVKITGFPHPHGLRSLQGRFLRQSLESKFEVIHPDRLPSETASPFEDLDPSLPIVLRPDHSAFRQGEPILMRFSKPLRPDSLTDASIHFFSKEKGRIPTAFHLVNNEEQALLSLMPEQEHISPGSDYFLTLHPELTDFSGNPISFLGRNASSRTLVLVCLAPE